MAYFPFFIDLQNKRGLIVGGGTVALRKVEKLLPYGPRLTVVSPGFCEELARMPGITRLARSFAPTDLEQVCFVIAATDDSRLNRSIAHRCRQASIPVNVVDDKDACTFLFPALVRRGPLSVGISTQGASPAAAIWLKKQMSALLPDSFDRILVWLEEQRPWVKERFPEERVRSALFTALFSACMEKGAPLTARELQQFLQQEDGLS